MATRFPLSVRTHLRLILGSAAARRSGRESLAQFAARAEGVARFMALTEAADDGSDEAPIFLLSAGWRSGSTLLQRLMSSGEGVLIWGEAYDRSAVVQHMADSLAPFSKGWPPPAYMQPPDEIENVSKIWAANLYPPPEALRRAWRASLQALFADPARELGARRWGFKEVRFGLAEARLLKGLYPQARFLFIRRRLEDTYLSYRRFSGAMDWYGRWPSRTAFTPYGFAQHWAELTGQLDRAVADTGGILVDYEDLVSGRCDLARIEAYVGFPLDPSVLERRIGSGGDRSAASPLLGVERLLLTVGRCAGARRQGRQTKTGAP